MALSAGSFPSEECPACGRAAGLEVHFKGLSRCKACGFVFLQAIGGIDFSGLYGDDYFAGEEYADYLGQERALRYSMRRHLAQMARYRAHGGALFEVGAAYGFFLDEARAHYATVAGIDIAASAASYARNTLEVDVVVGDFATGELGGREFDVVCMWDTIEHVPGPDRFIARAREALLAGGWLFLTTGDIGSLNARVRGPRWRQIHPPSHVNYFSRGTMTELLSRSGFRVRGLDTAAYYHTIDDLLATIRLRGGLPGHLANAGLRLAPPQLAHRLGFWLDLRDIMFVAAQRT
jgi:SAM-dependent methyltransferase